MKWNDLFDIFQKQGLKLLSGLLVFAVGAFLVRWLLKISRRYIEKIKIASIS